MGLCDSKETARSTDRSFYSTSFLSDSQCLFPQVFSIEFLLPRDSFSFLNSCSFFPTCLSKERSNVSLQSRWPFHPDQFSCTEKREGSDLSVGSKEKLESIEARGRDVKSRCKSIEKHAATRWTLRLWFLLCQGCRLHAPSAGTLREVTNPVIENQYLRSLCLMDGIRLANTSFLRDRNLWSVHRARPFHRPPPFSTCSLTTASSYPLSLGIAAALSSRDCFVKPVTRVPWSSMTLRRTRKSLVENAGTGWCLLILYGTPRRLSNLLRISSLLTFCPRKAS